MKRSIAMASTLVLTLGAAVMAENYTVTATTGTPVTPPVETYQVQVTTPAQATTPMAATGNTADETTIVRSNPPMRWSAISGEVTHVDQANRVVELELTGTDFRVSIPVKENRVGVFKNGDHRYALKDIKPGDNVTVRNLSTNL